MVDALSTRTHKEAEAQRLLGTVLGGKWRLDALIGMGGMASVFAATHRNGRRAAIKLLSDEFSRNSPVRERFLREGYAANHIGHPGVVGIMDDDVTDIGQVYLVMELLEGASFGERIHDRSLTPAQIVFIGQQVLEPLATAHRRGVIHRDIKPANIFICRDGRVKVLDFGLARVLDSNDLEPTCDGLVLGTVVYLSPEQARAKRDEVDWRTDIYSVGAMLFYALSGQYVHDAGSELDTLMAVMKTPAPSLTSVLPSAPGKVVTLVDRALRFDPAERWQCAEDMAAAAAEAFRELTGMAIPPTERTESDGKKGWACAAVGPTVPPSSSSVDVVISDDSIAISVVFEPDLQESCAETVALKPTPVGPAKD
jgi:eukaryotic-like serine/threonine-protein kinase